MRHHEPLDWSHVVKQGGLYYHMFVTHFIIRPRKPLQRTQVCGHLVASWSPSDVWSEYIELRRFIFRNGHPLAEWTDDERRMYDRMLILARFIDNVPRHPDQPPNVPKRGYLMTGTYSDTHLVAIHSQDEYWSAIRNRIHAWRPLINTNTANKYFSDLPQQLMRQLVWDRLTGRIGHYNFSFEVVRR